MDSLFLGSFFIENCFYITVWKVTVAVYLTGVENFILETWKDDCHFFVQRL